MAQRPGWDVEAARQAGQTASAEVRRAGGTASQVEQAYHRAYRKVQRDTATPKFRKVLQSRWRQDKTGVSRSAFEKKLRTQKFRCAICRCRVSFSSCADHCHKTGKFRGILCKPCNAALGLFSEKSAVLRRAAAYLDAK